MNSITSNRNDFQGSETLKPCLFLSFLFVVLFGRVANDFDGLPSDMDDDTDWHDVVTSFYYETNKKNIDFFKEFMIEFGKNLHQKNKTEYNPIKVEKIKQDIINKCFLRLDELKELYY